MKENLNVLKKLAKVQDYLMKADWRKDGKNTHQKYKYISEAQYKKVHGEAVQKAGLLFKFEVVDNQFTPNISTSMHLTTIKVRMKYIDPDTGEEIVYEQYGTGADAGDKGLYKAETGAYKYHIATNFHVAEYNDPENDAPIGNTPASKPNGSFKTPHDKKKDKAVAMDQPVATEAEIKALEKALASYAKLEPEKAKAFKETFPKFSGMPQVQVKTLTENMKKAIASLKAKGDKN